VFVLFADGLVRSVTMSFLAKFRINSNFVSSDKIMLYARSPDNKSVVNIAIRQAKDSVSFSAGLSHILLILLVSIIILILLMICRHSYSGTEAASENAKQTVDEPGKKETEEKLITDDDDDNNRVE
jgi:hypothetical protein